jgi:tryptophan-rich sensory protein
MAAPMFLRIKRSILMFQSYKIRMTTFDFFYLIIKSFWSFFLFALNLSSYFKYSKNRIKTISYIKFLVFQITHLTTDIYERYKRLFFKLNYFHLICLICKIYLFSICFSYQYCANDKHLRP